MANIRFIPPQMGPVSKYSVRALRSGPLWLLVKDAGVLMTALPYLPLVFFPLNKGDQRENYRRLQSIRDTAIQALLLIIELILLIFFLPALFFIPGVFFILIAVACVLIINLVAWPTQGRRIVESTRDKETFRLSQQYPSERWVFINGICTGSSGLQQNIDRLSILFGRRVLGIHNQSYGFISDLLECLLQRCISYNTMDVRIACEIVKDHLVNDEVKKVVLIGHSQGGLIVSMVVDYLLGELSGEMMGKLEIYTFGSAASHFHNPPTNTTTLLPHTTTVSSPCIPHIEHYANEYDMVPRWGVLYATKNLLTNRYAGSVFVRLGASGHMFVEHYMDSIFPLPGHQPDGKGKSHTNGVGRPIANGDSNGHDVEEADNYLDAICHVDMNAERTRKGSERTSLVRGKGKRASAEVNEHPAPLIDGNGFVGANGMVNGAGDGGHIVIAAPAKGQTVKELSRLWQYLGGASPQD